VPNLGCLFIGHGPKTLPVTWLTGNQIVIFLIKNSPDQVEGYLDYLQPKLQNIIPNNRTLCAGLRAPLEASVSLSIASQEIAASYMFADDPNKEDINDLYSLGANAKPSEK
jgi:hypothetical protein